MQIDWFTLVAQVVNFLVLVWLLKHFLYGRSIQAMNEREAKIASRLDEAASKRAEAEREAEAYRARNRELDAQREAMLTKAREEAEAFRQQRIDQVRAEIEHLQAQWLEALDKERKELLRSIREQMGRAVFTIARRALKDLADADLEQQMLSAFLHRLGKLEPAEREAILSDQSVAIHSAFHLSPEDRQRIIQELRRHFGEDTTVHFETEPDLLCGVELRAHSHRLAWNLDSYLEALEDSFFERLETAKDERTRLAGTAGNGPS